MEPILFTDVDGVINSGRFEKEYIRPNFNRPMFRDGMGAQYFGIDDIDYDEEFRGLDLPDINPKNLEVLNNVIKTTHCKLILSTGWRYAPKISEWLVSQGLCKMPDGETPRIRGYRSHQILAWIYLNRAFDIPYAIFDDRADLFEDPSNPHLVLTDFNEGLTPSDGQKAIKIMQGNSLIKECVDKTIKTYIR